MAAVSNHRWDSLLESLVTVPRWQLGGPVLGALALATAIVAATLGFQAAYADRVAAGVTVMGVELGGRTRIEARALLAAEAAEAGRQTVTLAADGQEWRFTARELGMNLDPDVLVDDAYAVGRSGNPVQRGASQWGALFLSRHFGRPAPQFVPDQLEAIVGSLAAQLDRGPRDAQIYLTTTSTGPVVTIASDQTGLRVLVDATVVRVRETMGLGVPTAIDLALETEPPTATVADFRDAKAAADLMLSAPLTVTFEERKWSISTDEIARAVSFRHVGGEPAQVVVNPVALDRTLDRLVKDVEQPSQSARFEWTGSGLRTLRESTEGRTVDVEAIRNQLRDRLLSDEHVLPLPVVITQPAVTTADAARINIQGPIREGRTSFAGATPEKAHNVQLATSRLNGVVVPAGGLFSFNREVGRTTLENGYRTGWGITLASDGARTVPSVAGGICQVATTLFQPVFHAGYAIEERHWHLYWINSYGQPPLGMRGLDATVDEDAGLDLQFINTTSDPILIQSRTEGSTIVFGLWGVKPTWDVKIEGPVITNVKEANRDTVHQDEPTMPLGRTLQVESAQDGFETMITRSVVSPSQEPRTLRLRSVYIPARNVILTGTKPA